MILPRLMKKLFFIFVAHYLKIKSELELLFAVFQLNLIKNSIQSELFWLLLKKCNA